MSMSKYLPVPVRGGRDRAITHEVIVVEPRKTQVSTGRSVAPLAKLALDLAPDLLRAFERSRAQRTDSMAIPATRLSANQRGLTSGVQLSEVELDMRVPFVRRVTVRRATAWTTDLPIAPAVTPVTSPQRGGRFRRVGVVGLGGAVALAALGLVANRRG
jgi:hypothetical protein